MDDCSVKQDLSSGDESCGEIKKIDLTSNDDASLANDENSDLT